MVQTTQTSQNSQNLEKLVAHLRAIEALVAEPEGELRHAVEEVIDEYAGTLYMPEADARTLLRFAAYLHDVGKAVRACRDARRDCGHEVISAWATWHAVFHWRFDRGAEDDQVLARIAAMGVLLLRDKNALGLDTDAIVARVPELLGARVVVAEEDVDAVLEVARASDLPVDWDTVRGHLEWDMRRGVPSALYRRLMPLRTSVTYGVHVARVLKLAEAMASQSL
jgi:hypothetical protein